MGIFIGCKDTRPVIQEYLLILTLRFIRSPLQVKICCVSSEPASETSANPDLALKAFLSTIIGAGFPGGSFLKEVRSHDCNIHWLIILIEVRVSMGSTPLGSCELDLNLLPSQIT